MPRWVLRLTPTRNGSLGDYAEYKKMCGVIEGLSIAEREIKELGSKIIKDEEDY